MKVIIKQDYENLGNAGDIKEVKNGYARNFLIPKGIVAIASESNVKHFQDIRKQQTRKIQKEIANANKTLSEIEKEILKVEAKVGEENKLFGSITSQMIFDKLVEKGYDKIDRKKIIIGEPIRSLGEHAVQIKLHANVFANLKVVVVDEAAVVDNIEENANESVEDNK
jgi:large subunit ribosomal protein L9